MERAERVILISQARKQLAVLLLLLAVSLRLNYRHLSMSTSTSISKYPSMLRAKQVAALLNCSPSHICHLAQEGILPRVSIGKRAFAYDPIDIILFSIRGF